MKVYSCLTTLISLLRIDLYGYVKEQSTIQEKLKNSLRPRLLSHAYDIPVQNPPPKHRIHQKQAAGSVCAHRRCCILKFLCDPRNGVKLSYLRYGNRSGGFQALPLRHSWKLARLGCIHLNQGHAIGFLRYQSFTG